METLFDFDRSLESVIADERRATYPAKLRVADEVALFCEWMALNPEGIQAMDCHAIEIQERKGSVAAKHLFEWLRWETDIKITPVPYWDETGQKHRFSISNSLSPLYARRLTRKYQLSPEEHKSRFDDLTDEQMREVLR